MNKILDRHHIRLREGRPDQFTNGLSSCLRNMTSFHSLLPPNFKRGGAAFHFQSVLHLGLSVKQAG